MAKKDKVAEFLASEDGKRNAERFIKALKEQRIVCGIPHVSSSGMSRVIRVREIVRVGTAHKKRYAIYQFDWFIQRLGWTYSDRWGGIVVGGCGMDMVFHLLYSVASSLEYYGFKVPKDWTRLTDDYMLV